jgi:hypothetical protein
MTKRAAEYDSEMDWIPDTVAPKEMCDFCLELKPNLTRTTCLHRRCKECLYDWYYDKFGVYAIDSRAPKKSKTGQTLPSSPVVPDDTYHSIISVFAEHAGKCNYPSCDVAIVPIEVLIDSTTIDASLVKDYRLCLNHGNNPVSLFDIKENEGRCYECIGLTEQTATFENQKSKLNRDLLLFNAHSGTYGHETMELAKMLHNKLRLCASSRLVIDGQLAEFTHKKQELASSFDGARPTPIDAINEFFKVKREELVQFIESRRDVFSATNRIGTPISHQDYVNIYDRMVVLDASIAKCHEADIQFVRTEGTIQNLLGLLEATVDPMHAFVKNGLFLRHARILAVKNFNMPDFHLPENAKREGDPSRKIFNTAWTLNVLVTEKQYIPLPNLGMLMRHTEDVGVFWNIRDARVIVYDLVADRAITIIDQIACCWKDGNKVSMMRVVGALDSFWLNNDMRPKIETDRGLPQVPVRPLVISTQFGSTAVTKNTYVGYELTATKFNISLTNQVEPELDAFAAHDVFFIPQGGVIITKTPRYMLYSVPSKVQKWTNGRLYNLVEIVEGVPTSTSIYEYPVDTWDPIVGQIQVVFKPNGTRHYVQFNSNPDFTDIIEDPIDSILHVMRLVKGPLATSISARLPFVKNTAATTPVFELKYNTDIELMYRKSVRSPLPRQLITTDNDQFAYAIKNATRKNETIFPSSDDTSNLPSGDVTQLMWEVKRPDTGEYEYYNFFLNSSDSGQLVVT